MFLKPSGWDAQAEAWAKLIPHDSPVDLVGSLRSMVQEGRAHVADMVTAAGRVGVVFYEIVDYPRSQELVVHGCYGTDAAELHLSLIPQIEDLGRRLGCKTVRFHTMRPPLVERAKLAGYHVSEVILRKTLC